MSMIFCFLGVVVYIRINQKRFREVRVPGDRVPAVLLASRVSKDGGAHQLKKKLKSLPIFSAPG